MDAMLSAIAKVLRVLNSETDPGQISLAFCFSMIAGLTPFLSLHNILVLLLILLFRVNLSTFILGLVFFSGVAYLIDPFFHWIGLTVLTISALEGLWTVLYNMTLFRLAKFNNSVMMGSLLFSIALFVPLYLLSNQMIVRYREHVLAWVHKSRIMQAFKATKFYRIYATYSGVRGGA
jgi:uncharacterized protein (TIGR03546 family)